MRIRWTVPAAKDLEGIKIYLEGNSPHLAEPTVRRIYESILTLKNAPNRGRPGRRAGTRELVLSPLPHLVIYRLRGDAIEILHIYHGTQNWA